MSDIWLLYRKKYIQKLERIQKPNLLEPNLPQLSYEEVGYFETDKDKKFEKRKRRLDNYVLGS